MAVNLCQKDAAGRTEGIIGSSLNYSCRRKSEHLRKLIRS